MMRRLLVVAALASLTLMVSGCDFFRSLAGRPTSADIEIKRAKIVAFNAAQKAYQDSLAAVERKRQKAQADSLAALQSLEAQGVKIHHASALPNLNAEHLTDRYYIVVGTFASQANAMRLKSKAIESGFYAQLMSYRKNTTSVVICPRKRLKDICSDLSRARQHSFCPADAWILVNDAE